MNGDEGVRVFSTSLVEGDCDFIDDKEGDCDFIDDKMSQLLAASPKKTEMSERRKTAVLTGKMAVFVKNDNVMLWPKTRPTF